jgi:hypothetical protein
METEKDVLFALLPPGCCLADEGVEQCTMLDLGTPPIDGIGVYFQANTGGSRAEFYRYIFI